LKKKVLIIAAHPDDEVIGCGGTAARLAREDHEISVVYLGEGVTSRHGEKESEKRDKELAVLKEQALEAGRIIGIGSRFFFDLPDNRFATS
jgi:LmbE family N-acetylglucosaminyl deacetylase